MISALLLLPLAHAAPWQHPFMADNGTSSIHNDAYMSDYYPDADAPWFPAGARITQTTEDPAVGGLGLCATHTFEPERGNLLTVCIDPTLAIGGRVIKTGNIQLLLMDPVTLDVLAYEDLGASAQNSFGGGGYFYMDELGYAVIPRDGRIVTRRVAYDGNDATFEEGPTYELQDGGGPLLADAEILASVLPDVAGNLWWMTEGSDAHPAKVGFVDPSTGGVSWTQLSGYDGDLEEIRNSLAADADGGVYLVSTHAMYRFEANGGNVITQWESRYDRGNRKKPGSVSQGSGTTPTLLDIGTTELVAIVDNADPYMNLVVYRRGGAGEVDPVCTVPLFSGEPQLFRRTATENTVIALPDGFVIENNHGYIAQSSVARTKTTTPGLSRVEVTTETSGEVNCAEVAVNTTVASPSAVPKAAGVDTLVYVYEKRRLGWYFTGLFADDLTEAFTVYVGGSGLMGMENNNSYAPVTITPDGAVLIGQLHGMIRHDPR